MYIGYQSQRFINTVLAVKQWFQHQVEEHDLATPIQIGLSHQQ